MCAFFDFPSLLHHASILCYLVHFSIESLLLPCLEVIPASYHYAILYFLLFIH
jgi:hypothetical protein